MSVLKKLAGQTAIYGLSHIVGRFLNYLLVPLHTSKSYGFSTDQYGVITEMYAYVAFLVILLTYGMETAFFRYYNKHEDRQPTVYSTAVISLVTSTVAFIALATLYSGTIAQELGYPNHQEYITWFAMIVGFDAVAAIPMARLRATNQAVRFAKINLISIAANILLNVIFIMVVIPNTDTTIGVGFVFIANLVASGLKLGLLAPDLFKHGLSFDWTLWKDMIRYALPILFLGLAGIVNEMIDKIMLKRMLIEERGEQATMTIVGIYGAVYKISIVITLFIQAFRYAAEPFFFSESKNQDAKKTYSLVMTYFVIVVSIMFLAVTLYIDIFKYFIPNETYWVGLNIVPILLLANICLGIYFNQSVWYKLTDRTIWGAYIATAGAIITVVLNYIWIPYYTYEGSAMATLICYASMMAMSYYFGQKYYPIKYNLRKIIFYLGLAILLFFVDRELIDTGTAFVDYLLKTLVFGFYLFIIWGLEQPYKLFSK